LLERVIVVGTWATAHTIQTEEVKMIRAHFQLDRVTEHIGYDGAGVTVHLSPIYYPKGHEFEGFTEYTPTGELEMYTTNPRVVEILRQHRKFALDFTPLEEDETPE
jgi:hypothetical protein